MAKKSSRTVRERHTKGSDVCQEKISTKENLSTKIRMKQEVFEIDVDKKAHKENNSKRMRSPEIGRR